MNNYKDKLTTAIHEIEAAFKSGDAMLYQKLGEQYAPLALEIFKSIDQAERSLPFFEANPVLLDPWTVSNRTKALLKEGIDATPYDLAFWQHPDLLKTLGDYLAMQEACNTTTAFN